MKRTRLMIITFCLSLLLCGQAQAKHSGPYVGALIGGSALLDAKASDGQGDFTLKFKPALLGSAVLGWDFEPGNTVGEGRVELEYSHRGNSLDQVKFVEGKFKGGGSVTAESLLINFFAVLHDKSSWAPYAGFGIGAARIAASDLTVTGNPLGSGSAVVVAGQLGAGIDVALTNHLNLDLGYRFFGAARPEFTEANGQKVKMDYFSHSAVIGLRIGF